MDAQPRYARVRRRSSQRTRLVQHSALADALANRPEELPPPARRVAGQRASAHRNAKAAAHEVAATEPVVPDFTRDRGYPLPLSPAGELARPTLARRVIITVCAVGVLAAGGATAYLLTHPSPQRRAAPPPAASATVRQAETWIRENLPQTASLRADPAVTADLISAGYPAAGPSVSIDSAGVFVVTTPANRDRSQRDLGGAAARISSLPVATFGSGPQRVDVSLLVGGSARSLPSRLSREASERRAADRALLTNPRLATPAMLRPWLDDGRLDLRAATVVALLAARTDVHVVRITLDPAEAAAARPARTVALSLADPTALTEVLRTLRSSYAPTRVVTPPDGTRQLTWPVGLAPVGLF
jgi:hypothetical protein